AGGLSAAMQDRLRLDAGRIEAMAAGLDSVAALPDPVGETIAEWTRPNGLSFRRVRVPLGVVGIIYESRPNVTADAGALCLMAGSAAILRSGSEAIHSARAIHEALVQGIVSAGLPAEYEAVARGASEVLVFGREAYQRLMDEVPGFARGLMAEFARRYDGTLRLLQAARHQGAAQRFALALAQLARERGRPAGDGWLTVVATQAELARLAHVSRQTANELLAAAEAAGEVRRGRGRWWWRRR
ncbi:MAG: hypothetical protein ACK44A_12680, partial [Roseateles sp.]